MFGEIRAAAHQHRRALDRRRIGFLAHILDASAAEGAAPARLLIEAERRLIGLADDNRRRGPDLRSLRFRTHGDGRFLQ